MLLGFFAVMFAVLASNKEGTPTPHGDGEYKRVPRILSDYIYSYRTATGDFDFSSS